MREVIDRQRPERRVMWRGRTPYLARERVTALPCRASCRFLPLCVPATPAGQRCEQDASRCLMRVRVGSQQVERLVSEPVPEKKSKPKKAKATKGKAGKVAKAEGEKRVCLSAS